MKSRRSFALPGLVIALALALGACGGGQPFPVEKQVVTQSGATPLSNGQARLLAAMRHTNDAKTAHLAMNVTMTGLPGSGTMTINGAGALDLLHRRFAMTLHGVAAGQTVDLEMRLVNSTVYVQMAGHWVSTKVTAADTSTPVPTNYLDYLQGIAGAVHVGGRETLRGVPTTRYSATVDLNGALGRVVDPATRPALKNAIDEFGLAKFPVSVWVDDAGRLRKMQMAMDLGALVRKAGTPVSIDPKMVATIELYDFGQPVDVRAPVGATDVATAHTIQSDLRNALTAEKVMYTDASAYSDDTVALKQIEPSLDWGGKLKVSVGSSEVANHGVVCLTETSDGLVYSIADIASGQNAGTYYGTRACGSPVSQLSFPDFHSSW